MIDWDNNWYVAWNILTKRLNLEDIKAVAACFDIKQADYYLVQREEDGHESEEEQKRVWISLMGNRIREYRSSKEKWDKASSMFRQFKELMGIWT